MKMKKRLTFILMVFVLLSVSFVSAHRTINYNLNSGDLEVSGERTVYHKEVVGRDYWMDNWNGEDWRDYDKDAWTHEAILKKKAIWKDKASWRKQNHLDFTGKNYDRNSEYITKYVPYLGVNSVRKCYSSPPADKLFYIKCSK
jgi:hypothetical protein